MSPARRRNVPKPAAGSRAGTGPRGRVRLCATKPRPAGCRCHYGRFSPAGRAMRVRRRRTAPADARRDAEADVLRQPRSAIAGATACRQELRAGPAGGRVGDWSSIVWVAAQAARLHGGRVKPGTRRRRAPPPPGAPRKKRRSRLAAADGRSGSASTWLTARRRRCARMMTARQLLALLLNQLAGE